MLSVPCYGKGSNRSWSIYQHDSQNVMLWSAVVVVAVLPSVDDQSRYVDDGSWSVSWCKM